MSETISVPRVQKMEVYLMDNTKNTKNTKNTNTENTENTNTKNTKNAKNCKYLLHVSYKERSRQAPLFIVCVSAPPCPGTPPA